MGNFVLLDVAIGLMFIYLTFSIVVTAVVEIISSSLRLRARHLRHGIALLLDGRAAKTDASWVRAFYEHPLIKRLTAENRDPSYIGSPVFLAVLRDLLSSRTPGGDSATGDIAGLIDKLPDSELRQALAALVAHVGADAARTTEAIENWYNEAMERVSGVFKRQVQLITFLVGLLVAVGLNVDTFLIVRTLTGDPELRRQLVAQAVAEVQQNNLFETACPAPAATAPAPQETRPEPATAAAATAAIVDEITCRTEIIRSALTGVSGLPIGWSNPPWLEGGLGVLRAVAGWLVTAAALWLGAPFWFDLLSRFVRLRGSGANPDEARS